MFQWNLNAIRISHEVSDKHVSLDDGCQRNLLGSGAAGHLFQVVAHRIRANGVGCCP
jgi:hypothetical protein